MKKLAPPDERLHYKLPFSDVQAFAPVYSVLLAYPRAVAEGLPFWNGDSVDALDQTCVTVW